MRGVPTSFHLGPFVFHTYGFGLAIAAYVAYAYARRRLERAGIDVTRFTALTWWLIASGLIGARVANIATNWSYYAGHPARWIAVWQGGLASFGGLFLSLIVGIFLVRRWWPATALARFSDALVPALIAGWALGRFLGPQFMVNGGGHVTHQWFGLYYHDQVGKRVPVPLLQGLEDGLLWLVLVALERSRIKAHVGVITGLGMTVWGLVRALDEHLLLGQESGSGSVGVQLAGGALALGGVAVLLRHWPRRVTAVHDGAVAAPETSL